MNPPRKSNLGELLRLAAPTPERPAADFWADFQARASLVPQAAGRDEPSPYPARRGFATALAALAIALIVLAQFLPTGGKDQPLLAALPPPPPGETLSRIEDVQIFLDHASITIIEDSANGGTVVFVETPPQPERT
ncbi:MAG: hypothetical protein RBU25_03645 [Lentisphaeria bacterium]|jgi:hypothetical protein|nr:hypothetical protein [Lentisphaeria bacterium]